MDFYIERSGLSNADPKKQGQTVGKAKRVRAVLSWALDNNQPAGEKLVESLISKIRASGGFRETSENYIGKDVILRAIDAFSSEDTYSQWMETFAPKTWNHLMDGS